MSGGTPPRTKIRRPWSAVRRHFQGRQHARGRTTMNENSPSVVRRPPSFSKEFPMNEEETPNVDEIKDRLKVEIPVEEEPAATKGTEADIAEELKNLGRQLADTLRTAWNSQERQKLESEIRRGVKSFADEVGKAVHEIKESPPAQRAREEASQIRIKVESGEVGHRAKSNMAQSLHWLSVELERLSKQFTPVEKDPEE
jgi:hypothetical protein